MPEPREQFGGPCPEPGCEGLIVHAANCSRQNDPVRGMYESDEMVRAVLRRAQAGDSSVVVWPAKSLEEMRRDHGQAAPNDLDHRTAIELVVPEFLTKKAREVNEAYDLMHKTFGDNMGAHFKAWLYNFIVKSLYQSVSQYGPCDQDLMAVMLPVGDWKRIYENMVLDVDACDPGPNVRALHNGPQGLIDEDTQAAAEARDAKLPAYSNGPATERAAEVINETLRIWGHGNE
jgi:hypothetical protein